MLKITQTIKSKADQSKISKNMEVSISCSSKLISKYKKKVSNIKTVTQH